MAVGTPREFMETVLPAKLNADPAKLAGIEVSVVLNIKGDQGGDWVLLIKDGRAEIKEGTMENPKIVIKIKDTDYLKLVNGELSGQRAFMTGKLKFKGDMSSGLKLQKLGII
jgi:putative sterol carrier protein